MSNTQFIIAMALSGLNTASMLKAIKCGVAEENELLLPLVIEAYLEAKAAYNLEVAAKIWKVVELIK